MINLSHCCILHWIGGHTKTVPFNKLSTTPIFYTAPSANAYSSFVSTFEAMEAPFFRRETTLLMPSGHLREHVVTEEFVTDKRIHHGALTKSGNKKTKEEKKKTREMELPFREALQRQWPNHRLALHTTDFLPKQPHELKWHRR